MSESVKLQAALDALTEGFLAPLLRGDEARVGRPIAPAALAHFESHSCTRRTVELEIHDALARGGADFAPITQVPWPSRGLLALASALYDLAFLSDPSLERLLARGAQRVVGEWVDTLTAQIPLPATRGDALARHTLIETFLALRRNDTVVKNWASTYRFFGRPVPGNVVALPRLRFVRQEMRVVGLDELLASPSAAERALTERLRQLVARSPVTELAHARRFAPVRFGVANLRVLADEALRGGIARALLRSGEWEAAALLGAELSAFTADTPSLAAPAVALVIDMHLFAALDERGGATLPYSLDEAAARYAAILPAWLEHRVPLLRDADLELVLARARALQPRVPADVLAWARALVAHTPLDAPHRPQDDLRTR